MLILLQIELLPLLFRHVVMIELIRTLSDLHDSTINNDLARSNAGLQSYGILNVLTLKALIRLIMFAAYSATFVEVIHVLLASGVDLGYLVHIEESIEREDLGFVLFNDPNLVQDYGSRDSTYEYAK